MILNRDLYSEVSWLRSWWNRRQLRKFRHDRVYKAFRLIKVEWPNKIFDYSPRLKKIPKFTEDASALRNWKESQSLEAICPTSAIKVTEREILIDPKSCISCGLCLEYAPPGLLEVSTESSLAIKES